MKPTMKKTTSKKPETKLKEYQKVLHEIRHSISAVVSAGDCYKAKQMYEKEHPSTKQGKHTRDPKLDRDPSFRREAARIVGVSASTIDSWLGVGKMVQALPDKTLETLLASSLGNNLRMLRQLATDKHDKDREKLILKFAKEEGTEKKSAVANLKHELGMKQNKRTGTESEMLLEEGHMYATGEHWDWEIKGLIVRVECKEVTQGRVSLFLRVFKGKIKEMESFLSDKKVKQKAADKKVKQKAADKKVKQKAADNEVKQKAADNEVKQKAADNEVKQKAADNEVKQKAADNEVKQKAA